MHPVFQLASLASPSSPNIPSSLATNPPHLPPSSADVSCLGSRYQQLTWHSSWPSKPVNHLKRTTQELEQELRRISNEMRKVRRQRPTGGNVQISAAQRTTTRALMVMRDGEPTATMTFLRSKRKGADPNATRWAEMDSELREWWISADEDTMRTSTRTSATRIRTCTTPSSKHRDSSLMTTWNHGLRIRMCPKASTRCPRSPFRKLAS